MVIPMFYFVKYFEDGPGMAAMVNSVHSYVLITGIAAIFDFWNFPHNKHHWI